MVATKHFSTPPHSIIIMGWEDIENMPAANLKDELLTLLKKEVQYKTSRNHGSVSGGNCSDITMRHDVCQWNYECADYFLFDREVVYVSMNFFDRFMAKQPVSVDRNDQQSITLRHMLALASLCVASKIHGAGTDPKLSLSSSEFSPPSGTGTAGRPPRKILLADFCKMSCGSSCPNMLEMLEKMEMMLLTQLQWKLHPPTPTDFLSRYIKILSLLLSLDDQHHGQVNGEDMDNKSKGWSVFELANYQLELAVYDHGLCQKIPPSTLAFAAILNAMDSKIVKTKRTVVSALIRRSFIYHLRGVGGGFDHLDIGDDELVNVRLTLKKLCSKTIVLSVECVDDTPSTDATSPLSAAIPAAEAKKLEYELSDVPLSDDDDNLSPVSVTAGLTK